MSELELLVDLLRKPPGYVIEVCGLYVARTRTGNFRVNCTRTGHEFDELRSDAWEAAKLFLKKREELKYGYDLEKKPEPSSDWHLG